jgi:hypothetical protein
MAVDHVKSTAITNLDAGTAVNTAGRGARVPAFTRSPAMPRHWHRRAPTRPTSSCRVPSNCSVKSIIFESEAQGAGKFDLGLYYATDGQGGHAAALLAADAVDQDFFATVIDCASAVTPTEVTNESGTYTLDKRNQPPVAGGGLATDPGGYLRHRRHGQDHRGHHGHRQDRLSREFIN